jgi:hypothetical protein
MLRSACLAVMITATVAPTFAAARADNGTIARRAEARQHEPAEAPAPLTCATVVVETVNGTVTACKLNF